MMLLVSGVVGTELYVAHILRGTRGSRHALRCAAPCLIRLGETLVNVTACG